MWHAAPAPPHAPFLLGVPNARTMRDIDKLPVDISLCIIKSLKKETKLILKRDIFVFIVLTI